MAIIDAQYLFGQKFIRDHQDKTWEETNERLRVMGQPFTRMISETLDRMKEESTKA